MVFLHRDHLGASKLAKVTRETIRKVELVITAYPACTIAHKAWVDRRIAVANANAQRTAPILPNHAQPKKGLSRPLRDRVGAHYLDSPEHSRPRDGLYHACVP